MATASRAFQGTFTFAPSFPYDYIALLGEGFCTSKIAAWIIRHRKFVAVLFIVMALAGAVMSVGVKVNNNLVDYLPADAPSTIALREMETMEFGGSMENARVMVPVEGVLQAVRLKDRLADVDGVDSITWLDDVADIFVPLDMMDSALVRQYYRDGFALFSLTIDTAKADGAVKSIRELIGSDGALAGQEVERAAMRGMVFAETRNAISLLLPLMIIILVFASESWLEPLLYLAAIGVSVLINMGTNIFLKDVSFITQTVSPILQMAASIDYAVFLIHRFRENRKAGASPEAAMGEAMQYSFVSISSSSATTMFGFMALMFMKFQIGADLGLNLLKGIMLSFISVIIFLPALTLLCVPILDKAKRNRKSRAYSGLSAVVYRLRWAIIPLVLIIVIPSYMAQSRIRFEYGMSTLGAQTQAGVDAARIGEVFGRERPLVLMVPSDSPSAEDALIARLAGMAGITRVVSYGSAVGGEVPSLMLDSATLSVFESGGFRRVIMYTSLREESDEAFALVENIRAAASEFYSAPDDVTYLVGQDANLYDIRDVVQSDSRVVNWIAIGAIALVLLIAFRSISLPVLLVFAIEAAIWINMAASYIQGQSINYLGYLVVSAVQLGATVDYAILLTDKYRKLRRGMRRREAITGAVGGSVGSLMVSALILALAGIALALTSTNGIVAEMGLLLMRGTLLSLAMVVFFLPATLYMLDPVIRVTTLSSKFLRKGSAEVDPDARDNQDNHEYIGGNKSDEIDGIDEIEEGERNE